MFTVCVLNLCCVQCSVTCGSGQQTREITCIGSGGMRLEETSCSTLHRPLAVRPCEMAVCPRLISWHVGEWGLVRTAETKNNAGTLSVAECEIMPVKISLCVSLQCTTSCGSGSRDRQVICSDQDRNLYPAENCLANPKPSTVERCNTQPCYSPQGENKTTS